MSDHPYSETCGCPGCQFMWAAEQVARRCGKPLQIGQFTPTFGDMAEDPRYPGFFRTWTGDGWHPRLLINEPVCICKPGCHSQYGCDVDDSDLPACAPISQTEAMRVRSAK